MAYEHLVRITKALSHPVRVQIAEILSQQEACVCHLEHTLGQRQAYISQQLGVLKHAGILRERREGTFIYYRLKDESIVEVLNALRKATNAPARTAHSAGNAAGCPCPICCQVPSQAD